MPLRNLERGTPSSESPAEVLGPLLPFPKIGITAVSLLHTGQVALSLVSPLRASRLSKQAPQNRCPHSVTTGPRTPSRQMLQSKEKSWLIGERGGGVPSLLSSLQQLFAGVDGLRRLRIRTPAHGNFRFFPISKIKSASKDARTTAHCAPEIPVGQWGDRIAFVSSGRREREREEGKALN